MKKYHSTVMRVGLLATTALASAFAPAAFAQTSTASESPAVGELVVTAQKRAERLTDVPISITALTGESLVKAGIVETTQLAQVTPGLQFGIQGAYAQPQIRGIGASIAGAGADPNVAIYVDGVYMPSQNSNFLQLVDVAQIEILKGPQGTLYGRNATGGAINVNTRTPGRVPEGLFTASYGSYGQVDLAGFASGPLGGEIVSASVSGFYHGDDGYSRDVVRNTKLSKLETYGGRAKLRIAPSDNLTITLTGDASHSDDTRSYSLQVIDGNIATPNSPLPTDPRDIAISFDPTFRVKQHGVGAQIRYDLGFATITNTLSHRQVDVDIKVDSDRSAAINTFSMFHVKQKTLTEELNISSNGSGPFKWTAGLFYFDDTALTKPLTSQLGPVLNFSDLGSHAYAIYAQADYELVKSLTLTAGIRYSDEKRSYDASRPTGNPLTASTDKSWDAFTPRLAARYAFDNRSNIYASWSRGFKSGLYNSTVFSTVPVNPETVDAFEAGYKFGSGGTLLSVAAFHYQYNDIQVQILTGTNSGGSQASITTNAAKAKVDGAEAQFSKTFGKLSLNVGAAYTNGRYTAFPNALLNIPKTTAAQCGTNLNRPCGNIQQPGDASGNQIIRSPKFTGNIGFDYETELAGGELNVNGNLYYNSGFYWNVSNRLKQNSYEVVNSTISWSPPGDRWKFSVWGRNLTDKVYAFYAVDTAAGDARAFAAPRAVGAKAEFHF